VALAQVTFKIKVAHGGMLAQHKQRIIRYGTNSTI
jgi:hypothetical protein